MGVLESAVSVAAAQGSGQDRAAVFEHQGVLVAVLADGAGGSGGGARAASTVVERVAAVVTSRAWLLDAQSWSRLLLDCDAQLEREGGQSTAVIVASDGVRLVGVSVGDSQAWVVDPRSDDQLTDGQPRKPLLGGGCGVPRQFAYELGPASSVLLASDGLLNFAPRERILAAVRAPTSAQICCAELVQAARLPGGGLTDDVSVVVLRRGG